MGAFEIFKEMKAKGVPPDVRSYNTLIQVCSESNDLPKAQKLVQEMELLRLPPNETTHSLLARCARIWLE
eukprot:NODE_9767_length_357_cov_41.613636_g8860_i0.p2 GENE.NODE_9767_length_357_cov_41.613636_g8860_i0~~NODE_9767_length_357_cov_41.613636_g8860_i0.p2  ORF type:complete len:70 (+),score=13.40 NODE_9767_length_357_cov_41.613636_g8860_i0:28-237(+)